jgi:hypothetical protein
MDAHTTILVFGFQPLLPKRLFLFAQRSWQTQSLLDSDLTPSTGKRIQLTRASLANGGV